MEFNYMMALNKYSQDNGIRYPAGCIEKKPAAYLRVTGTGQYVGLELTKEYIYAPTIAYGSTSETGIAEPFMEKLCTLEAENSSRLEHFFHFFHDYAEYNPDFLIAETVLRNPRTLVRIRQDLIAAKYKGDLNKAPIAVKVDGRCVVNDPRTLALWKEIYLKYTNTAYPGICILTGKQVTPLKKSISIKGLGDVGGNAAGAKFYTNDMECSQSYTWGNDDVRLCIDPEISAGIAAALNHLIANSRIVAGQKMLCWYKEPVEKENDLISLEVFGSSVLLPKGDKDEDHKKEAAIQAQDVIQNMMDGNIPANPDNIYHILFVKGNGGRVVFSSYFTDTFDVIQKNMIQWEKDKEVVSLYKGEMFPHKSFQQMLRHLVIPGPDFSSTEKRIAGEYTIVHDIFTAMIQNRKLNYYVLPPAMHRLMHEAFKNGKIPAACLQWFKLYHVRQEREKGEVYTMSTINPNHPSQGYQLGRLLAVYHTIYQKSLRNKINNEDTFLSRNVESWRHPVFMFPEMERKAAYHLQNIEHTMLRNALKELWDKVATCVNEFPRTLELEEGSYFMLGYHHEMAAIPEIITEYFAVHKKAVAEIDTDNNAQEEA